MSQDELPTTKADVVYSLCPVAGVAQVLLSHLKEKASSSYKSQHDSTVTGKGKTVTLPFSLLPSPPNHDREDSKQQPCKTNTTITKRQSSVDEKARKRSKMSKMV